MKKAIQLTAFCLIAAVCVAFSLNEEKPALTVRTAEIQAQTISIPDAETPVRIGGYGSSMAYSEADSAFYLLTDRGPNVDGAAADSKIFPLPEYTPHIGKFRLVNGELVLIEKIELKEADGTPFSGIPDATGNGAINETALNLRGEPIANNSRRGIDPEGLTRTADGSFWVSEEYAPCILHFSPQGILIEEFSPFNGGLPPHYALRRPNRGMEGLTLTPDGTTLVGIMQSPLTNATDAGKVLIISLNIRDKKTEEYLYPLSDTRNVVSEIAAIGNNEFLILERDSKFPQNGKGFKKIFKISLPPATETVSKELFLDILAAIPAYPHDKPEGIALINNRTICIVNDDDFGINSPAKPDGGIAPKLSPAGLLDKNVMYFVEMGK